MRFSRSNSVRTIALSAGFCALGIAGGCGQQTFDLLPNSTPLTAGQPSSPSAGAGAGALAGSGGSAGASAGEAGKAAGTGGKVEMGGFGGRLTPFPPGGGTGQPCFGEGGCPDEMPLACSPTVPYCIPCRTRADCIPGDPNYCDPDLKRCVQCRTNKQCDPGEICNTNTYRCVTACAGKDNSCDKQHSFCSQELGFCVACVNNFDCSGYGPYSHCVANICVECTENVPCMNNQTCRGGYCIP